MKNFKIHRAWLILACMLLIQGCSIGVLANALGVVFAAIRSDLGFRTGDLSIFYMIRSFVGAAAVIYVTRTFFNKNSRLIMVLLGLCQAVAFGAMAFFSSLWQWYAAAVIGGVGMCANGTIIPVVINNWFRKKNGLAIGITMSASGIFGAIFSPVFSSIIENSGWRVCCLVMAACCVVMIILPAIFILVVDPADVGEKPYGYEEGETVTEKKAGQASELPAHRRNVPGWAFAACVITVLGTNLVVNFTNQVPVYAETVGYTLSVGALLTSVIMVGNLSGKLIVGALTDRLGIYRAVRIVIVMVAAGVLIFWFGYRIKPLLFAGSVAYGWGYSMGSTLPPLLFLDVYGRDVYREMISRLMAINSVVAAVISVVFPYIYDFTGSFVPVFAFGVTGCTLAMIMILRLRRLAAEREKAEAAIENA